MSKWSLRYANEEKCEHGFRVPNCDTCYPVGVPEKHHGVVFNLIQHLVPTLHSFSLVGREYHAPTVQEIINEISKDHMDQFPGCRHCANLREQAASNAQHQPHVDNTPPPTPSPSTGARMEDDPYDPFMDNPYLLDD
jgi:hypothetical protein